MSADDVTLNPFADAIRWLNRHLPRWAKVALPVVIAAGLVWWYWEHVNRLPGVSQIVEWWETESLPEADPDRFAVAIASLENDPEGAHRELIADALQDLEGVQILRFDRSITLAGGDPEEVARRGHESARSLLEEARADVLIWGRVLMSGGERASRLYWTTSGGLELRAGSLCQPQEFELPAVFWEDLRDVLRLLVVTAGSTLIDRTGQFIADRLEPFTNQVRSLLEGIDPAHGWDSESCARVSRILATSLTILGQQTGREEPLNEAIGLCNDVLEVFTRKRAPLEWATTQNNLGVALSILGERHRRTTCLDRSVAAYEEALKELTRDSVPLDWAMTQNNLGVVLTRLGERDRGTALLEEAVVAFKEALKERTLERVPLDWAITKSNLGVALRTLGERERDPARVREAIAAYEEALSGRTRDCVPLDWALTQNNLGVAHVSLWELDEDTAHLKEAVAAYREALKERTRGRVPLDWAATQSNTGGALLMLGVQDRGTIRFEEAIAAFTEAREEFRRESAPFLWAKVQSNIGTALRMIAERTGDIEKACDALEAHLSACGEGTPEYMSRFVGRITRDLALLKDQFPPSEVEACLKKHEGLLKQFYESRTSDEQDGDA